MVVRFLRNVFKVRHRVVIRCGDGCCSWPEWEASGSYLAGEEIDPNEFWNEVDLSSLKYKEDYEIVEYP